MKVVLAIDSFKGSLTSEQAENAVSEGILRVYPDAVISAYPIADGGEGTVEALQSYMGGKRERVFASNPLGRKIECEYVITENKTAIIEMSAAAGITLLSKNELNPLITTTYGVGEMIADAIKKGCRSFIIGIGGSATNDGGIGMLQSLGFGVLDKSGKQAPQGAGGLKDIYSINAENAISELSECSFTVACDVKNPLCGENGCSKIFGPQKGADKKTVEKMDEWMLKFAEVVKGFNPNSDMNFAGAGAAGGLGFALKAFLNAKLESGIELIIKETGIEESIKNADIVITGEGRFDSQTAMGKVPGGIAWIAKKYNKTVIAFSGSVTKDARACNKSGIDAYFPILREVCTLQDAMNFKNAYENLADTVEQVFNLVLKIK